MAQLEAVIFDFDGVIVDSEPIHYEGFRQVMRQACGEELTESQYYARYVAYADKEAFEHMAADRGLACNEEQIRQWSAQKTAIVRRALSESIDPLPGVLELMLAARDHEIAVGICSSALREEIEIPLTAVAARSLVQCIVSAEDVPASKPDPAGYLLAVKRLGEQLGRELSPAACVAIEDSPGGTEAALAANLHVLAVTNTVPADQLSRADRVVDSLAEITLADLAALIA